MEYGLRRGGVLWWTMVVVVLTCTVCQQPPQLFQVGGKKGWTTGVNYTEWAAQQRLYAGDWLLFRFDKHYYSVLEVNETSYQLCNDQNFITNITRGGRDVFNLTQARPYYFLSGGGYCFQGMKLAINVEVYVPAPLAPPPSKNGVYISTEIQDTITVVVWIALALDFLLKYFY
ncbi:hypothetical protein RHGRI_028489 [Rhododendron griersonianum]|uniref:Phytocyanin domain-containing protein n=1 Tax=Rhododendron griersonianum TaxID=479676 RepID=A0AAV6IJU9_9ERIC|nr:hypothetical protein RHGRI_028489 [Rhododendron griersonianum]